MVVEGLILADVAKKFWRKSERSLNIFGTFSDNDIPQQFCKKTSVATETF